MIIAVVFSQSGIIRFWRCCQTLLGLLGSATFYWFVQRTL